MYLSMVDNSLSSSRVSIIVLEEALVVVEVVVLALVTAEATPFVGSANGGALVSPD